MISGVASGSCVEFVGAYSYLIRWSFNITLLIIGVFATAAGISPDCVALCSFATVWSIRVGGNLLFDSAVFLSKCYPSFTPLLYTNITPIEFISASHQCLLTVLSIWRAFGQLVGSLVRPDYRTFCGDGPDVCVCRLHGR